MSRKESWFPAFAGMTALRESAKLALGTSVIHEVTAMRSTYAVLAAAVLFFSPTLLHAQEDADSNAGVTGEHDFNMYCASCHGENAKGNGPKAFSLAKKPPDLTLLTTRYGEFPREKLARMIDGRDPIPGHGEREMPVWGVWFKAESAQELGGAEGDEGSVQRRVDNLVDYIEGLQVK
jgi:mono/diheme cytochrome c family protein